MFLVNYNNSEADRVSEYGKVWMTEKDIIGTLRFRLPYAGIKDCLTYESLLLFGVIVFLFFVWIVTLSFYPYTTIFTHGMSEEEDDDDHDFLPISLSFERKTSLRFNSSSFKIAWRLYVTAGMIVFWCFDKIIIE